MLRSYNILTDGFKTVASITVPERLVSASTPCRLVWVGAPLNDNASAVNTSVVRVSGSQAACMGFQVLPTDGKGYYIPVLDAYDLWLDAGTANDGLRYVVLG